MDNSTKITKLITRISQISADLGFQAATTGKKFIEPDVRLELETAHIQLMLMYDELRQSCDEYQKTADTIAVEHKVEREQLQRTCRHQISVMQSAYNVLTDGPMVRGCKYSREFAIKDLKRCLDTAHEIGGKK